MSDYLMHDIGFRGVIGVFDIAKVLRRAEDFECKCVEELTLGEDAVCGFYPEACFGLQIRG